MKKALISKLVTVLLVAIDGNGHLPYQNAALSSGERAKDLMSRLTLEEKASLMFDQSPAILRLGVKNLIGGTKHCMGWQTMIM